MRRRQDPSDSSSADNRLINHALDTRRINQKPWQCLEMLEANDSICHNQPGIVGRMHTRKKAFSSLEKNEFDFSILGSCWNMAVQLVRLREEHMGEVWRWGVMSEIPGRCFTHVVNHVLDSTDS